MIQAHQEGTSVVRLLDKQCGQAVLLVGGSGIETQIGELAPEDTLQELGCSKRESDVPMTMES